MGVSDPLCYDPYTLRKRIKNIGRAYREQATTLVQICRIYVDATPKTNTENDCLQNILRLADAALSAAGRANKGTTSEATDAFLHVQEEMKRLGSLPNDAPVPQWGIIRHPNAAMEAAFKRDEKSMGTLSRAKAAFMSPDSKVPVNFVILKSPHERHDDQVILHQEMEDSTTISEIIWRFSRLNENSPRGVAFKVTFKHNPHFYLELSDDAASYGSKFHKDPLKDLAYVHHGRPRTIYVLSDKSCRLYLDAAPPHRPRIFSNLWRPHRTIILKDVSGALDSEDIIPCNIGANQDYWYRPSKVVDPSQYLMESGHSDVDSIEIVEKPAGIVSWRSVVKMALRAKDIDFMIRDRSMPEPTSEWTSNQRRLPYHMCPQLEPTNASTSSSDSGTLSTTSIIVNTSNASLMPEAPGIKRTRPDDGSKDLRVKVSNFPQRPPPMGPASYSMTVPSPLPELEPRSANAVWRKGQRKMFDACAIWDSSDIDQQRPPSPEPRAGVQEPEDRSTPRQSATRLPQLEYSNPNSSVTSIGVSMLSSTSSQSFVTASDISAAFLPSFSSLMLVPNGSLETIGNLSAPSIYTLAEVGSIDIDYLPTVQVELPAADTLSTTPPSPPPANLPVTTPSPPPAQDRELLFDPSFLNKLFEYDDETES